jgi:hypothetical protein
VVRSARNSAFGVRARVQHIAKRCNNTTFAIVQWKSKNQLVLIKYILYIHIYTEGERGRGERASYLSFILRSNLHHLFTISIDLISL